MKPEALSVIERLRTKLRRASVAEVGGFRPPSDPTASWIGRGVCLPGEKLPLWRGTPMFPLIQIRTAELPYRPPELDGIALLVLFHNHDEHPVGRPHGDGWLIREYPSLDGLVELPPGRIEPPCRRLPIRWSKVDDDAPGWEDGWGVVDLAAVNDDDEAADHFHDDFKRHARTKVGGYPSEIRHGVGLKGFVFQVASEERADWMWFDNGMGYFFRSPSGEWRWSCQFI